jgi:hypothetical protein
MHGEESFLANEGSTPTIIDKVNAINHKELNNEAIIGQNIELLNSQLQKP